MNRLKVESSNLASVGYDESTQTLEIEFNHGAVYQYSEVDKEVYDELMEADSKGSYFNSCIRGAFPYVQVKR
jgi:KTSC domain